MTAHHRVKGKRAWWFITLLALAAAVMAGAGGYYLYIKKGGAPQVVTPLLPPPVKEETISLSLFFASPSAEYLVQEDRQVARKDTLVAQVKEAVRELVRGSLAGNQPVLSDKARVREVFIDADGVAFVDFSREVAEDSPGGSWTELAAVYGVINTLAYNFPEIRKVQILVEGAQVSTLAGHIDIRRPLPPRMGLVEGAKGQTTQ